MVCRFFGRQVSLPYIRDLANTGVDGTSLAGIARAAEGVGLAARTIKASKSRLDELPLPAIVHWEGIHWVVLWDVRGDKVKVADPALGNRTLPRSELEEQWSGYAALLAPTPALADAPEVRADFGWLRTIFRPHRGTFLRALVLALLAAGMQFMIPVLSGVVVDDVIADRDYTLLTTVVVAMAGADRPDDGHPDRAALHPEPRRGEDRRVVARLPDQQAAGAADELLQLAADRRHRAAPGRHAADPHAVRAERRGRADRRHAARRRR